MGYVLEKWNSTSEDWDDISEKAELINPELHLDIFDARYIEYNGKSMELDADGLTLLEDDYIRFRSDAAAVNYQNILYDLDSEMYQASGHHWADSGATISFDINTTVGGKMFVQTTASTSDHLYIWLPNYLTKFVTYRVKFKARLNSGSGRVWRFGQIDGADPSNYYEVTINQGTETQFEGTFTTDENTYRIFYFGCTATGGADAIEIDDIELYVESPDVIFSGIVKNLVKNIRANTYEFDLINEIADLKEKSIKRTLTGTNLLDRLRSQLPADYVLIEMDAVVRSHWANETRGNGMLYGGDEVVGTDTNNYACILSHVSAAVNQPITGGDYQDYWSPEGSSGGTWAANSNYDSMLFSDLLFDTLLILNSYYTTREILFYAVVINREIRIYSIDTSDTPTAIADADMNEIEGTIKESWVDILYEDLIKDELKGQNYTDGGNYLFRVSWAIKVHKFHTIAEHPTMTLVSNSGISGFITGIDKKGSMYEYEVTEIEEIITP